jgi:hypothetical protein
MLKFIRNLKNVTLLGRRLGDGKALELLGPSLSSRTLDVCPASAVD